jgi:hypothetical protein
MIVDAASVSETSGNVSPGYTAQQPRRHKQHFSLFSCHPPFTKLKWQEEAITVWQVRRSDRKVLINVAR